MKRLENVNLAIYTTFKIGGVAKNFYIPEDENEIVDLTQKLKNNYKVISGGSNILIDDTKKFENIIYLKELNKSIEYRNDGQFYVGCSVRIQRFIKESMKIGYGGLEFLYSIPGMIGGSLAMNAGKGRKTGQSISNHVIYIDTICNGEKKRYYKDECDFSYRNSIFKNSNIIIVGALFQLIPTSLEKSTKKIEDRLNVTKNIQDHSGYSFGSLFCSCNRIAMELIKLFHPGNKNGCSFSSKTVNWIVNKGQGTFNEAMHLIHLATIINKLFLCKPEIEVILWTEED